MTRLARWHRLALCAVVAGILYLPGLGKPALWEPDEGRYAEIAREMVQSGDYVTPRDDWVRYFEKPPLMYWATSAAIRIIGPTELAVRLPAALFSVAEVVVTCALAEAMFDARAGLLAAMALALSPIVWGFARFLTLDPALAFFVTAGLGSFYAAARAPDLGAGGARRWLIGSAAMAGLGTLTKGPVALVICGGVALAYLFIEGRMRELAKVPWIGCGVVFGLIVAPWFFAVSRLNPEFLRYFFIHEHLQRYVTSTEHAWGPWFLVAVAAGGTWPWLYFVPIGLSGLRHRTIAESSQAASALRFLTVWFLFVLVFFSIPRSKLGSYVLPAIPALAILAGRGLLRLGEMDSARIRLLVGRFAIVNLIAGGACVAALVAAAPRLGPAVTRDGLVASALITIGAVAAFAISKLGSRAPTALAAFTIAFVAAMVLAAKARRDAAPLVSYRGLARAIGPYLEPGCLLASYGHQVQSLPFYTETRETMVNYLGELAGERRNPDAAKSFLTRAELLSSWGSSTCVVLVINHHDWTALSSMLQPRASVIACEGKKLALYNRPARGSPALFDCGTGSGAPARAAR